MAQTGYTPILSYSSATASAVPLAANLSQGELAVNTNDGKLFFKDSSGVVQTMASKATGSIGGSTTQVQFNNAGVLGGSASLTWSGTVLTSSGFAGPLNGTVGATTPAAGSFTTTTIGTSETLSYGTANGVAYLNGSKVLTSGSALTFDGTNLALSISQDAATKATLTNSNGGTSAVARYEASNGSNTAEFGIRGTAQTTNGVLVPQVGYAYSPSAAGLALVGAAGPLLFAASGTTEGMRLTSTGLGIGTSSPAAKLDVQTSGVGIQLKQSSTGSATYYVMDNTVETSGKRWRFGYTGAAGIPTFSLYNQTDNVTAWVADAAGNLGLGVTPSAWSSGKAVEVGNYGNAFWNNGASENHLTTNAYYNGGWKFGGTGYAQKLTTVSGQYQFNVSTASGTAGNAITFTQAMTLDASGNLSVGTTSAFGTSKLTLIPAANVTTASSSAIQLSIGENTANSTYSLKIGYIYASSQYLGSIQSIAAGTAGPLALNADGGNVGIGTSSPTKKLDVYSTTQRGQIAMSGSNVVAIRWNTTDPNAGERNWEIVNNVDGQGFLSFRAGTSQGGDPTTTRMVIDSSGNLLVGTTSSSGSVSSDARVVGGIVNTLSGTNSITTSPTTVATLPNRDGATYLFTAQNISDSGATTYGAVSIITQQTTALVATALQTASFTTLSVSGLNLQITSTLGTKTYKWSLVRIM